MSKTVNNYIVDKHDNVFIAPDAWILVKSNQGNQKGHNRTWEIVSYSNNAEDLKKELVQRIDETYNNEDWTAEAEEFSGGNFDGYIWDIIPCHELPALVDGSGTDLGDMYGVTLETEEHVIKFAYWLLDGSPSDVEAWAMIDQANTNGPIYQEFLIEQPL